MKHAKFAVTIDFDVSARAGEYIRDNVGRFYKDQPLPQMMSLNESACSAEGNAGADRE